jgi:radical SAM protein with 4Fe4S-binding SPASM domain
MGWTGGEPLLRDDLEEIITYAHIQGITRTGITTNGILVTESRARSLQKAGVSIMQISIDGSTAERNREIRRATLEDFDAIMSGIRACRAIDLRVDLAMLLSRATIEDAEPFLAMADREGIKHVRYCGFVPMGRGKGSPVLDRMMFNGSLGDLRAFAERAICLEEPIAMFDPAVGPTPPAYEFHDCIAGVQMMYLSCTGDVFPCTSLIDRRFKVGNLRERLLADIWNDPKMTEIARFPRDQIHGQCRECEQFSVCHGACRGVTYSHTGDLYASFPVCLRRA